MQVHVLRHCCFVELLVNAVYVLSIPLPDFLFRKSIYFPLKKSVFLITSRFFAIIFTVGTSAMRNNILQRQ